MSTTFNNASDAPAQERRSKKDIALDVVSFFARFCMALMWISAGVTKLDNQLEMSQVIHAYGIFTEEWSHYLAWLIGPLEVAGGVLLLLGIFLRAASKVSIAVLVLFIIGIAQAWARGLNIDCGCFGVEVAAADPTGDYIKIIVRDIIFIVLSAWTVARPFKKWAIYTR